MKTKTTNPQAAHTSGDWIISRNTDMHGTRQVVMSGPQAIAYVYGTGEINEANARLIAAAPMMFAALKSMVAAMGAHGRPMTTHEEDTVIVAEAAIAAAKGA